MLVAVRLNHIHLLPLLATACGLEQRDPATGGTALHAAAVRGATGTAEWLLRSGANAATRDNAGRTPAEAALAAGQHAACKAIREAAAAAAGAPGGRPSSASAMSYDHSLLSPTSPRPGSAGGAAPAMPFGSPGYGGVPPYGTQAAYGAAAAPPAGPGPASSTPWQQFGAPPGLAPTWQQQQQPGAGVVAPAPGPGPGAGGVGGRLQVPDQPPPPAYYPAPLPGAGVYF
ncbi:Ankyrin repeat domain-containing protein 6 [Tetrabaena socialis]|uniref:Ankyrin repeat domain-containing protein 6 n=1 Tax=Tetrabaena socialis TaxID=47790 RepID=A0A2J8AB96_9CHLO|nr:Ankyrin repeat domain-containing protein 6 [Tetrabaena socialis]|eukprot:PNH09802.1 Ankyrin repeat domain-containing protein 6 [Tetrabaena socialis]